MRLSPHERAVRYKRLALAEPDPEKSRLLYLIANEAERGVLATADWMTRPDGPADRIGRIAFK